MRERFPQAPPLPIAKLVLGEILGPFELPPVPHPRAPREPSVEGLDRLTAQPCHGPHVVFVPSIIALPISTHRIVFAGAGRSTLNARLASPDRAFVTGSRFASATARPLANHQ